MTKNHTTPHNWAYTSPAVACRWGRSCDARVVRDPGTEAGGDGNTTAPHGTLAPWARVHQLCLSYENPRPTQEKSLALYAVIVTTLAGLALGALALALGLIAALALPGSASRLVSALTGQERHPIGWAWFVALLAMAGSLYLSEIAHLLPCSLCWYQRIAMYPLVLVLGVGLVRGDPSVWRFALPLPVVGLIIAAYHVTIQWRPSLDIGACSVGAPCSGRYLSIFGFVSIPVMAGSAFLLVIVLLLLLRAVERAGRAAAEPS
ncbi:MAG: disulfide bond formation protein B [Gemmatimonadales bacterium]|nr:MAG: disulfide bond formation protein B [Gemmatimonadales bacterium]